MVKLVRLKFEESVIKQVNMCRNTLDKLEKSCKDKNCDPPHPVANITELDVLKMFYWGISGLCLEYKQKK